MNFHNFAALTDESLPEARSSGIPSDGKVRLEAELAGIVPASQGQWRHDLPDVVSRSGETCASEEHLEEDLGVEIERRRIERCRG